MLNIVKVASNLYWPRSAHNIFSYWLQGIDKHFMETFLWGLQPYVWFYNLCCGLCFKMCFISSPGYSCIYTMTSYLAYPAEVGGRRSEDKTFLWWRTARKVFSRHGWRCYFRIGSTPVENRTFQIFAVKWHFFFVCVEIYVGADGIIKTLVNSTAQLSSFGNHTEFVEWQSDEQRNSHWIIPAHGSSCKGGI